jgi:hypothetical protein
MPTFPRLLILTVLHFLREPKVHQLKVSLGVDEDVLGLQVSICDAFRLVQELEYEHNLGGVELRCGLVEASRASQVAEDLTARAVVELRLSAIASHLIPGPRTTM